MATLFRHSQAPAHWCRLHICLVNGRLFVRAYARDKSPGTFRTEHLSGTRHAAALLHLAQMLADDQVASTEPQLASTTVCFSISCGDRPCVGRPALLRGITNLTSGRCDRPHKLSGNLSVPCAQHARRKDMRVPLVFSYMSSVDHHDVPWPDYLFAGKPQSGVPRWSVLRRALLKHSSQLPYHLRDERMLYASKLMHTDRSVRREARTFFAQCGPPCM